MSRYRFRLATVLRVRRMEEEAAKLDLRTANVALRRAVVARDRADERYRARAADRAVVQTAAQLHAERLETGLLADQVAAAQQVAMERASDAALAQARWSKAAKRVAVLDRLAARRRAEHAAEERRAEVALVDDLVTARYAMEHAADDQDDASSVADRAPRLAVGGRGAGAVTVTVSAIQGWGTQVGSTVTSAATALESMAPTGAFAGVLEEVAAALRAGPGGTTSATGVSTAGGARTTATFSSLDPFGSGTPIATGGRVTGSGVVHEAEQFLGTPYVWGGESPTGFDCSGLVQYVYGQLGISLPRTSEEQALVGTPVASLATATPGDLVFFAGSDGTATAPGHVGIYVGDGMMVDAPYTGTDVQIQPVSAAGTPVAIRRIVATPTASASLQGLGAGAATQLASATTDGGVPSDLAPLFVQAAGKYGVPVTLLTAVARHESGFDTTAVSTAGAEGLMQIMPSTAAGLGVTPLTARQAIDGAAQLLSGYLDRFGSVPLALAAYNAGAGAVEEYGGIPPYGQTESYVDDIMQTLDAVR